MICQTWTMHKMFGDILLSLVTAALFIIVWCCLDYEQKQYEEEKRKTVIHDREYTTDKWYRN